MAFGNRLIDTAGGAGGGWTLANAVQIGTGSANVTFNGDKAFDISADGTKMLMAYDSADSQYDLVDYNLTTPFDITTLTRVNNSNYTSLGNHNPKAGKLAPDGTVFNFGTFSGGYMRPAKITMATAYNVSTTNNFAEGGNVDTSYLNTGGGVNQDGSQIYVVMWNWSVNRFQLKGWTLSTPYDFTSSRTQIFNYTFNQDYFNDNNAWRGLTFDPSGNKMFILLQDSGIYEWDCSTPFDPSTAVYSGISVNASLVNRNDFKFSPDGKYLYMTGNSNTFVQFQLY